MKEEKRKVGRPKLADGELKKQSKIIIAIVSIITIILATGGIFSLSNTNLNRAVGNAASAGKCYISSIGSEKNQRNLKYSVKCTGGATISDTKYQVAGEKMIARDNEKRKVKSGEIVFKQSRIGKSVKLRVYYNDNKKYDEKTIVIGSGKKITEATTTTKEYSKNPATTGTVTSSDIETYSVVNAGAEPNTCYIRILANNGKTIKYQVLCQANARPLSLKLVDGNDEAYILKDFKNHKGYMVTDTYTATKEPSKSALLKLTYKKTLRNGDENDTKYIASRSIYENGTYKIDGNEVAKINTSKIPTDKCTISVSNVRTNRFKWTVKCDQGARPISVRLTEAYNGREGSQIKGLPGGNSTKYGITKSEVSKSYVSKGSDYTLVLYFGTKQKDYYRTTVSFTTPMTNPTTTTKVSATATATTKPGTPKTTTTTAAKATTTTKETKECIISAIGSKKNSNVLSYKVKCTGGAQITDTKYKTPGSSSYVSRDSDKRKLTSSSIIFKEKYIGKTIYLRVYYGSKYDEASIKLGSGLSVKK